MKGIFTLITLVLTMSSLVAEDGLPSTRVGVFTERSDLDRGYADWREHIVRIQRRHAPRQTTELALGRTSRFGLDDTRIELEHFQPLSPSLVGSLYLAGSPTSRVLPRSAVGAALQYEFSPGWLLHGGFRHTRYRRTDVERLDFMLERYVADFGHSLQWSPSRALARRTDVLTWRSTWYPTERGSLGFIASAGEEATEIGGGSVALADVRSLALIGRLPVAAHWSLTGSIGRTRQGTFYTRTAWGLGVQRDF